MAATGATIGEAAARPDRPASWSVRWHLVLVVAAAVLPLLLLAALLGRAYVAAETERFERGVRDAVFETALDVERDLTTTVTALRALATSRALQAGGLAAFHAQASEVKAVVGTDVVLRDAAGHQLVSTLLPWGAPLPTTSSLLRWDAEALAGGERPFVTGHYRGVTNGVHSYAVVVPVRRDGATAYLLHASIPATRLRDALATARLPPEANLGVTDRDHVVLARNRRHEEAVGTASTSAPLLRAMTGDEATGRQVDREGREVFVAFRRIGTAGWTLGVGVPVATILAPLHRTLWTAGAAAGGLAAFALAGAWFFGRRLAGSIRRLATLGDALERGTGRVAPPEASGVREVDEVASALAAAAARHDLMLHELNHRVRNTLATVDSLSRLSARHATSVGDHQARLSERIRALGNTHVLLADGHWGGADLRAVLRAELAVHDAAGTGRVALDGPPVALVPRHAVAMGMLAHELATNAAKHGALSRPEGRVEVRWTVSGGEDHRAAPRLDLLWREAGGPPVAPPTRKGFGTQLIERALARDLGAEVAVQHDPGGLRVRLSMPVARPGTAEVPPPPPAAPVAGGGARQGPPAAPAPPLRLPETAASR